MSFVCRGVHARQRGDRLRQNMMAPWKASKVPKIFLLPYFTKLLTGIFCLDKTVEQQDSKQVSEPFIKTQEPFLKWHV